jgi:phytoene dehydrogenase-like protein
MDNRYDVIVVGAGMGGASCAALLARRGHRVLLADRNAVAGGKAMTVHTDGLAYELWPVVSGPSVGSRFEVLLEDLGATEEVELLHPDAVLEFIYHDGAERRHMVGAANPAGADPTAIIDLLALTEADLPELLRFFGEMAQLDDEATDRLEGTTFSAFLDRFELPASVRAWLGIQSNIIFVVPVDELDAAEAIRTLADFGVGGAGRYHAGGYGRIAEVCCDAVTANGGDVLLGVGVERILVEDGTVHGVELTDGRRMAAPIVVSNAGIQPTVLALAGEAAFDTDYVDYVRGLRPSRAIVGRRYVMKEPFFERGAYFTFSDENYLTAERFEAMRRGWLPEEVALFNVVPSNYDPSLATDGRQMALVGTFCDPDVDLEYLEPLLARVDESMERVWPGFHDAVESSVAYGTQQVSRASRDAVVPRQGGECIGLGQVVGQCGSNKPSARSPLHGLFYVGCDAGGYGCGTHQAVDSGINVADLVHMITTEPSML